MKFTATTTIFSSANKWKITMEVDDYLVKDEIQAKNLAKHFLQTHQLVFDDIEIKLLPEAKELKYKVGDMVRIIGSNANPWMITNIGEDTTHDYRVINKRTTVRYVKESELL